MASDSDSDKPNEASLKDNDSSNNLKIQLSNESTVEKKILGISNDSRNETDQVTDVPSESSIETVGRNEHNSENRSKQSLDNAEDAVSKVSKESGKECVSESLSVSENCEHGSEKNSLRKSKECDSLNPSSVAPTELDENLPGKKNQKITSATKSNKTDEEKRLSMNEEALRVKKQLIVSSDSDSDSKTHKSKSEEKIATENILQNEQTSNDNSHPEKIEDTMPDKVPKEIVYQEKDPLKKNISAENDQKEISSSEKDPDEVLQSDNKTSDDSSRDAENGQSGSKSFIKCVDLKKLLRSPLKTSHTNLSLSKSSKDKNHSHNVNPKERKHKKEEKSNLNATHNETKLQVSKIDKRKELVNNFVPKKFSVKINRLPSFSENFLKKHNLQRITRAGMVLAQMQEKIAPININAKNDLLNESSDSSRTPPAKKPCSMIKSKRKEMMESIKAKRQLLIYSSSSDDNADASDARRKKATEELKRKTDENKSKLLASSSSSHSDEDVSQDINGSTVSEKALDCAQSVLNETDLTKEIKKEINESSENKDKDTKSVKSRELSKTSISQVDGNDDSLSSSDKEMGRKTRSKTSEVGSSENDDKVVDGLVNLKNLEKKSKSRNSPSDMKRAKKSKSDRKNKQLDDDVLLEADSKSASESEQNIDGNSIPEDQNDEGAQLLAREELLLQEEDSSDNTEPSNVNSEKNGDTEMETKKKRSSKAKPGKVIELNSTDDESEEQEQIKGRRRKHEVISSDSDNEGKSKTAEKDSDYDEPEAAQESDDSNEQRHSKRKAKSSDSDSNNSSDSTAKTKKKRRRIKKVKDSDASGSDSENEGKKHGRKNIRKVMGKDQLEEATKKAAREERERIARISERQKLYNNTAFDESGKPDEIKLDKVVLDFDPDTKEPLIQVDPGIVKKLKPHQANGIKFMWDACFESVKQIKKSRGSGCILAHCMGLGKTLQVVSLTHTLLTHKKLTGVRRVLVVCPLSTVLNWVNEFRMWTSHADKHKDIDIYELSRYKQNRERSSQLEEWMDTGGVCVLGYEMFRNLSADNSKKFRKKMLTIFQESLVDPGPDLVVCDEGHLLKNEKTSLSQSMNRVRTLRRIVLTGTPLQNNLKEYYCMVQFVKPNLLGKYNEYLNRFVNPITNGQYTNSTEQDIRVMKRRSHVLHKMLDGAVQRRDYGVLAPFLPPKHEYVLFITLTEVQIKLYQHYLDNYSRRQAQAGKSSGFLFPDFQALQRIWTHPRVLKANSERYEIAQQKKRDKEQEDDSEGSIADFLNDESTPEESSEEEEDTDISEASDDSRKKSKKKGDKKAGTSRRATRANPGEIVELDNNLREPGEREENPTEWWVPHVEESELEDMRHSNKLVLLFDILRQCEAIGDKLLVFSQSLYSLDLIEYFLWKIDEATQSGKVDETLGGHVGSWSLGVDYFRLDGSSSCENRSIWCKNFNREDNPRARLFLISTRAGGLGINLVAANRVVIFDVSWNPSHDVQSIFRVYRFGQKKPCYIYRFLAMGTMEEKIYERQVTKQAISKRVIDEQQIDRHYTENDLAELYTFQPKPSEPRPVPLLPKDRLFAEMLKEHEALIYRFHEHDSLLENKEEETLTEEERKAAWEDFENEKNRPPPPLVSQGYVPHLNGMNNIMQQQLMLATMVNTLRKEYPNFSEQQITNLLSTMLYADPSMLHKMRGMPGMNAGMPPAAMMAPMGPTGSGYAPTWQQQQQIQLQRLQAQQAAMNSNSGVKYYSGGLGSRDPVSMALQQKQQREMMLSSTQDRLRDMLVGQGRPRVDEVVDLDSE